MLKYIMPLLPGLWSFCEKLAENIFGVPCIWFFQFCWFNGYVSVWISLSSYCLGLCVLPGPGYLFPFWCYESFQPLFHQICFLSLSLSPRFEIPRVWMLVHLMLSQRSLKLSSINFFSFCCFDRMISAILSSRLLKCSSVSPNLLLNPSSVFSVSVIVFFSSDCFHISFIF